MPNTSQVDDLPAAAPAPARPASDSGPLVSVVIPVYNAARFLRIALESILSQTLRQIEVIALDDGSADGSKAILDSLARQDPRLRVISRPNTGIVGALNDAIAAARGEFIARMDADDISLSTRLEKQLAFLTHNPGCVAVGTDVIYTDPEGDFLIRHRPAQDHASILAQLLEGNGGALIHPTVMFRRSALDAAGGYRVAYQWIEDLDLYLRLSDLGQLANLPEVQFHYRQHLQSVNRTRGTREALRRELIAPYRQRHGLPEMLPSNEEQHLPQDRAGWRRHWAYDAARGGHWTSARKNAWKAFLSRPFDRRNWQCLRYVLGNVESSRLPATV